VTSTLPRVWPAVCGRVEKVLKPSTVTVIATAVACAEAAS
jgi:hypothetical protein